MFRLLFFFPSLPCLFSPYISVYLNDDLHIYRLAVHASTLLIHLSIVLST
jgi:hypothetical protein